MRRAPLVSQHLENVSRDALVTYQQLIRQYIRGRQGVYALFRKGRLYYVGLASNLRGRLTQHIRDRHGKSWDRFSVYLTIGDTHLRELESLVLRIAKPTGNKQKGKFAKSENLRRRFNRDIQRRAGRRERGDIWRGSPEGKTREDGKVCGKARETNSRPLGIPGSAEDSQGAVQGEDAPSAGTSRRIDPIPGSRL